MLLAAGLALAHRGAGSTSSSRTMAAAFVVPLITRRPTAPQATTVVRMSTRTDSSTNPKTTATSSSRASSTASSSFPSLQQLLTGGQALLKESVKIAQEVGPRAGLARTLSATKAFSESGRDLLVELRKYQQSGAAADSSPFTRAALARSLRQLFERLGSTYIKVGQFIASSPTLFPEEFVLEFQKCLDQTAPIPYSVIRDTLRAELGGDAGINEKFESIDPVPLASASIAQVHTARLKGTGEEVVLKVLKPGVTDTLKADLGFIYLASRLLETIAPELVRTSLGDIVADIRTSILEEVDFTLEAKNIAEFRAFLDKAGITAATCPTMYPALSTKKVLTMERLKVRLGEPMPPLEPPTYHPHTQYTIGREFD